MLSAILNTWLPRSNFIYSNNTLLAAGCCKSKLRYLKHWYRLLFLISSSGLACENIRFSSLFVSQASPGLVKPILGHSFGRSWYKRVFHTPRTSFLLTTRLWKHISCSDDIFIPEKNLRAPSRVACSRLRDSGGKSFSKRKFSCRHRPLSQVVHVLFSLCSF